MLFEIPAASFTALMARDMAIAIFLVIVVDLGHGLFFGSRGTLEAVWGRRAPAVKDLALGTAARPPWGF